MTTHPIEHLLNTSDKLDSQIDFAESLAVKWRENNDHKMSQMYAEIASSLQYLQKKNIELPSINK